MDFKSIKVKFKCIKVIKSIDDIKFLSVRGESFAPKQTFKHKDTIFSANNKKMFQKNITIKIIVKNFAKFQFFC